MTEEIGDVILHFQLIAFLKGFSELRTEDLRLVGCIPDCTTMTLWYKLNSPVSESLPEIRVQNTKS